MAKKTTGTTEAPQGTNDNPEPLVGEVVDPPADNAPANNGMALVPANQTPTTELTKVVDEALDLFTRDGWQATDTGVTFPADRLPSVDEILSKAAFVGKMGRVARIWLGDIIRQTTHKYGEMYTRFAEVTGYSVDSLKQSVYAMAHVLPENRHANLTFYHMRLAADLPEETQKRVLALAAAPYATTQTGFQTTLAEMDKLQPEGTIVETPKTVEAMPTEAFATLVKNVKKHGVEILDAPPATEGAPGATQNLAKPFFRCVFRAPEPKEKQTDYDAARRAWFDEVCKRYDNPAYAAKAEQEEAKQKAAERLTKLRNTVTELAGKVTDEKKRENFKKAVVRAKDTDGVNAVKAQIGTEIKVQLNAAKLKTDYDALVKDLPATFLPGLARMRDRGDKLSDIKGEIKKVKLVIAEAGKLAASEREGIYKEYASGKTVDAVRKLVKDAKKASDNTARDSRRKKLEQAKHKDTAATSLRAAGDIEGAVKVEQEARQLRYEADGGEGEAPENWKPTLAKPGAGGAGVKAKGGKKKGKK